MNQQITQTKQEDEEILNSMDKFFLFMSIGYLLVWFLSIPFFRNYWDDASHGGFFDHVGTVAFVYLALSVTNRLSKTRIATQWIRIASYALFGFFIAFPLGGMIGAIIVSALFGFYALKKDLSTSFITGALGGYWLMLFIVSCFEYNPFTKTSEGFMAMIFEFFAALFNMANYNVHHVTLSWFVLVPIGFGYFFFRTFESAKEERAKRGKQEQPKEAVQTAVEEKPQLQPKPQATPVIAIEKEDIPSDSISEPTTASRKRYKEKNEKPSKGFFGLHTPTSKIKWKNWWEQTLRNLSK